MENHIRRKVMFGNAIIGQSGGPTAVINSSLCGVVEECLRSNGRQGPGSSIGKVLGMRFGVEGFMQDMVVDLGAQPKDVIERLKTTPSSALGSCRYKLKDADFPKVFEQLRKYDIRYFFLIGGNDTMDTIHRVEKYCREQGYELRGVGIPKTVDNDLFATDHTPGFASAARYVALSVLQAGFLLRAMKGTDQYAIFQTIGRSAGWLPAAAACAKNEEGDAPHIILLPERPFDQQRFLTEVKRTFDEHGWVSIVCGEGICRADGRPISDSGVRDKFGNVEFGATAGTSAALALHKMIMDAFDWRGEFQVTESLQMCAADRAVQQDYDEAYACGKRAVELALGGTSGVMVTIRRESDIPYRYSLSSAPLSEVALGEKPLPDDFICSDRLFVTEKALEYLRPLVGELPKYPFI
jgi:6-phosphofructokinase 1